MNGLRCIVTDCHFFFCLVFGVPRTVLAYQNMQNNDAFKPETLAEQNIEVYALEVSLFLAYGLHMWIYGCGCVWGGVCVRMVCVVLWLWCVLCARCRDVIEFVDPELLCWSA